ncbi:MAG: TlpA family protein disulfide reductase [Lachnospiraceae bacterium]|nr:TlpA family protein disulfide reductase [Lachnospiraceae bacterium]
MEKGKNTITTLILTGSLLVILALGSALYPKITAWYEGLSNGGSGNITNAAANNTTVTPAGQNQNTDTETFTGEPVTIPEVPLAETKQNGAKDFYLVDKTGKTLRLSDFYGKPVVVNLWATWCGYCKEEFPGYEEAYREFGDTVQFLMVDLCDGVEETRAKADKYIKNSGYTFPVYYETLDKVLNTYGVGGIPLSIFINSDGTIYETKLGAMSKDSLFKRIRGLISNQNN